MIMQIDSKVNKTGALFHTIENIRNIGSADSYGLILSQCGLQSEDLQDLETLAGLEDPSLKAHYLYDRDSGMLGILLEGKKLSETHRLALFYKGLMDNNAWLNSSMVITSDDGSAEWSQESFADMMGKLSPSEAREIVIYHQAMDEVKPATILIIDDDPDSGEILNMRLQMRGYEVHTAVDGEEGLRLAESLEPDVVITELSLPVYDGFHIIRSIRKNEELNSKVMVLTDHRLEEDVSICLDLGAADYVKKPYSPVELEARIRRLIN